MVRGRVLVLSALNYCPLTKRAFAPRVYLARGSFLLTAFRQRPSPRSRRRCLTAARPIVTQMARAEGDHFAENAYAFPRCRDCGDDILGASGHADSAPPRRVADGRSSRQRVRPQPIPGTRRGVPFVWTWSLSGWILWVARGKWLPTRLLAWPVGALPQHAVPRKASGRIVVLGRGLALRANRGGFRAALLR
jgi:hypothetical protein